MDVALECTSTRIRIFLNCNIFLHKSVFSLFTRTKPSSDVHSPKPLVFSPAGLFNMVLRLTESTQTREIKRAVSYGNKRTGPKKLEKRLKQRTKDYALTLVLQYVMLKNEQLCKSLYFTGFFNP